MYLRESGCWRGQLDGFRCQDDISKNMGQLPQNDQKDI